MWIFASCVDAAGVAVGTPAIVLPAAVVFDASDVGATATLLVSNEGAGDAWVALAIQPPDAGFGAPTAPFAVPPGGVHEAVLTLLLAAPDVDAVVEVDAVYDVFDVPIRVPR